MAVYNDRFGERVREILRERHLGPNDVQRESGGAISHQTVRNMMRGVVPYVDYILEFAEALESEPQRRKELADDLLRAAGKRAVYSSVTLAFAA